MSAHELGATAARHFSTAKLNRASADVVNAYLQLDLVKAWGDATSVAADGTQVDTLIDNLLAESHIRYGGYGGSPTTTSPTTTSRYQAEADGRRLAGPITLLDYNGLPIDEALSRGVEPPRPPAGPPVPATSRNG